MGLLILARGWENCGLNFIILRRGVEFFSDLEREVEFFSCLTSKHF